MKQYGILILPVTAAAMVFAGALDPAKALGMIFSKDNKTLIHCPENATSVTIPDGVISIRYLAFADCSQLPGVTVSAETRYSDASFPEGCKVTVRKR